ncbi:mediator of RNA polymerase II transcription subunit 14 isoform X1 [Folsomia candida]|uniref:mediator of RNA polymerase II transcription subunit 14 isoform X1 n=1 Tax=Folsomia candida TaxID=158441 RepID=UPI000B8F1C14|nr:mediator of RNA polymerase II transcription subunit 14 isoform X1 [Folsomia candida]
MERKQEIFNFSARTRLLAVRLLALVKWASSAAKVDKSVHIMAFLEKQSMIFVESADILSRMARETLVHARLPNFHVPAAVEVLTTGTYNRLPTCIRERIVPPDPITTIEKKTTLNRLNQVIQHRLVTTQLPAQMRNLKIDNGRVLFRVENEFQVSITVLGDGPTIPWRIIEIELLVEDKDIGDGMTLAHPLQIHFIHQLAQSRLDTSHSPLKELYDILHAFAQSLQLEVLYSQVLKLCRERLGDLVSIEEYTVGRSLILGYWKELSALDPKAELGYRLVISTDPADPAQPLGVTHQPPLTMEEANQTCEGLRSNQLEKIMVHTVYLRSKNRLSDLKKEVEIFLGVSCTLQGSPPILSIPVLAHCLKSEQLLVTVNIQTGSFLVHIPQFEHPSPHVVSDIQQTLNSPSIDTPKLKELISQLRYWITERRCEKTLQHLPASAGDRITLLKWDEHPILRNIGKQRLTIKFQRHPYAILIVEFHEIEEHLTEMEYNFYLVIVKKASADENEEFLPQSHMPGGVVPKFYLKPVTVMPLDTFAATHGPYTEVDVLDFSERVLGKRKMGSPHVKPGEPSLKKQKNPAYFVPELAHIVAMCDERLPFALLTVEFSKVGIIHSGCTVLAQGSCLGVGIFRFPSTLPNIPQSTLEKLDSFVESAFVRTQTQLRGHKTWNLDIRFTKWGGSEPVPNSEKPLHFVYDMALSSDDHVPQIVRNMLDDWLAIAKMFHLVLRSNWCRRMEASNLVAVKSFHWNRLVLSYGPSRAANVTIFYSIQDKCYKLSFGGSQSHNPHTLLRLQLQQFMNSPDGTLDSLMKLLNDTYEPLYALTKLPSTPQLGVLFGKDSPHIPVQTFVLVPRSPYHVSIVYCNVYCLDVHFQSEGLVSIKDGAYSQFDKSHVLGEFSLTQGLKAFLSKYVDENAMFRRRSQSEDDNPPSPISTMMEMDHSVGTPGSGGGGPGSSSPFLTRSQQPSSPAPGRSNPHTPASPHIQQAQNQNSTGFSPAATSLANLASPPSLSHLSQQSPNPSSAMHHHPTPSPSTLLPAPSPSAGPMSVPTPSPNPGSAAQSLAAHGPASAMASLGGGGGGASHPSPFFHAESSPAPMPSPWANAGSPGMPRPATRVGHSPQGHGDNRQSVSTSRVLPQKSWAGAIPTTLTADALDILCTPTTSVDGVDNENGYPCRPLERFLGCSYLRRQLQRIVTSEDNLHPQPNEPGVIMFRSDSLQFRVSLDPNHFQSLHLKVNPVPESQNLWSPDEIQLLEKFFATKVVSPPFRPYGLAAFAKLVSLPTRIIKDCLQIIRLQLIPSIVEQQGWKWNVQLCLTVPPSQMPIVRPGMSAIVTSHSKILLYLLLTRAYGNNIELPMLDDQGQPQLFQEPEKIPFVVLPLIHELTANSTQLAEKRAVGPPPTEYIVISEQLRRFVQFHHSMECSIFPAVQDLLMNLTLPPESGPGSVQMQQQQQMQQMQGPPMIPPQMGQMGGPPFASPHAGHGM